MSAHLESVEFVEHLDGVLAPARERHLQECGHCRARLDEWETLAVAIRETGIVPEPSPLFWDHFSARVHEATAGEPVPIAWWRRSWVPFGAMAGVAVAVMLAISLRTPEPRNLGTSEPAELADVEFVVDQASWEFVTDLASSVPFEELRQATGSTAGATDDLVAQLTPTQAAELVRLVKLDKGSSE